MILTLTANPSLDRTVTLGSALVPGQVHRISQDVTQPGGKGVNVALGVHRGGAEVTALLPASPEDPLVGLLTEAELPFRLSPLTGRVRTNLTVVGSDGVTTKINEPGPQLGGEEGAALEDLVSGALSAGDLLMLSGSLAPGLPQDLYARLVHRARSVGAWVGIDTSDAALARVVEQLGTTAPDMLKPNAHELGQILGVDGDALERSAAAGDLGPVQRAATRLHALGVREVLVTLGSAGAVLVTAEGAWWARTADVPVRSTVGAGDSATAGYLLARSRGSDPSERLALATSYGAAAVTLQGTTIPDPDQAAAHPAQVQPLPSSAF
ncbi:1-phosphofructokinase family hexose kinase [Brachybacterium sp. EF45031]|uniref:1-phosphofructokinase family hexose kinase n=1 Tax=Brachybacterium sillae TaxID=2810536 RepID=UPI00217D926B|nr:1-phosphofructokinase family hexose kinase [Brachybacterium sillae]MCS6710746.1 1-phosphofructokinase family hexose kinase [Brachybacterium sillae]